MKKFYKKIVKSYHLWRYLRLYRKLFWFYTRRGMTSVEAVSNACEAFGFLAGFDYDTIFKRYS